MSDTIIVRVQSPDGTKRITTKSLERISSFIKKVGSEFDIPSTNFTLHKDKSRTDNGLGSKDKTLSSCKIRHGDMLFLTLAKSELSKSNSSNSVSPAAENSLVNHVNEINTANLNLDDVDKLLYAMDGLIYRERNEQLCHHGPQGKCLHCVPLEPYDEQYLKSADPPIKFLSFHSFLRKCTSGVDKGKFTHLENISCKIKSGCTSHPPWPDGICTKCQPNAVTLNRQTYRHLDYIQFENHGLMDRFLNYWRISGNQRIGFMYGRYEYHKEVPLGIKAVVCAIYEPPQECNRDKVTLLEDKNKDIVESVASRLGLQCVGWIFTDLIQNKTSGTVKNFRGNINSHFLSAEECIMAAHFQNSHPNACKLSSEKHFGSKFGTVVVTGDMHNQIQPEAYQVSNQCMALVRDNCLLPTIDCPELGYIRESSNALYVPDVFYKEKDNYGNEITKLGRPLPVEYLLVDMPAAFPVDQMYTFPILHDTNPFPIENRDVIGECQNFNVFATYITQFHKKDFLEALSDFHLLIFMNACDVLPLRDQMDTLLTAIKNQDRSALYDWTKSEEWGTVESLMTYCDTSSAHEMPSNSMESSSNESSSANYNNIVSEWTCIHCTFVNSSDFSTCEMCRLPKS